MDFKDKLRNIIDKSGLTRDAFADKCKISTTQLYRYLKGEQEPGIEFLRNLKHNFPNVNLDGLISEEDGTYRNKDGKAAPTGAYGVVDKDGLYGKTRVHEVEGKTLPVTLFTPDGQAVPPGENEPSPSIHERMTLDEIALVRTLRLCGDEYKKRVYIAATVRAQNVIKKRKLETKEKLKTQEDLEVLSTAAIE